MTTSVCPSNSSGAGSGTLPAGETSAILGFPSPKEIAACSPEHIELTFTHTGRGFYVSAPIPRSLNETAGRWGESSWLAVLPTTRPIEGCLPAPADASTALPSNAAEAASDSGWRPPWLSSAALAPGGDFSSPVGRLGGGTRTTGGPRDDRTMGRLLSEGTAGDPSEVGGELRGLLVPISIRRRAGREQGEGPGVCYIGRDEGRGGG